MDEAINSLGRSIENLSRELQSSEERFRDVINRLADAVIIVDRGGIVRFANRAAQMYFDRHADELIGAAFGFPVLEEETTEIDLIRRGGQVTVAEMRVVAVEWEGEEAHLASLRDITDRKRSEAQRAELIREQAARAEAEAAGRRFSFLAQASALLADSLNYEAALGRLARLAVPFFADYCAIDLLEKDGFIREVASALSDASLAAQTPRLRERFAHGHGTDHGAANVIRTGTPEMAEQISDAAVAGDGRDDRLRLMRSLGMKSYIIVPMHARGRTLGAISFAASDRRYTRADLSLAEDLAGRAALSIDNARLYLQAQKANRLKDEFLATISHELRTPLTSVMGWVKMMRTGRLDDESFDYALDAIERNARGQAQIISDILDVSDIIHGKLRLNVRQIGLREFIEPALESIRPAAQAKEIALELKIEDPNLQISGDPDRLQQAVWNLASNAVKFTPKGGRVLIKATREGDEAEVSVSDTGQGIDTNFLPHVFDRFRQADSSITREHGGLGLGLALVRHLVEMHGGTVRAESDGEGRGARFTIRLPFK
jgi:signal transduction histidine kinase